MHCVSASHWAFEGDRTQQTPSEAAMASQFTERFANTPRTHGSPQLTGTPRESIHVDGRGNSVQVKPRQRRFKSARFHGRPEEYVHPQVCSSLVCRVLNIAQL